MIITTRIDLNDGNALSDFDYGSTSVTMFAKQMKQRDESMIGFGFAMFSVHQI